MNYSTHNQQMRKMHSTHRKTNYALRKLSVGVASVLLSTTIFGLGSMAHADTVPTSNDNALADNTLTQQEQSGNQAQTSGTQQLNGTAYKAASDSTSSSAENGGTSSVLASKTIHRFYTIYDPSHPAGDLHHDQVVLNQVSTTDQSGKTSTTWQPADPNNDSFKEVIPPTVPGKTMVIYSYGEKTDLTKIPATNNITENTSDQFYMVKYESAPSITVPLTIYDKTSQANLLRGGFTGTPGETVNLDQLKQYTDSIGVNSSRYNIEYTPQVLTEGQPITINITHKIGPNGKDQTYTVHRYIYRTDPNSDETSLIDQQSVTISRPLMVDLVTGYINWEETNKQPWSAGSFASYDLSSQELPHYQLKIMRSSTIDNTSATPVTGINSEEISAPGRNDISEQSITYTISYQHQTASVTDHKDVIRTINITNPDGTTTTTKQTATLTRTGTKDLVTNDTTWGDWSTSQWDKFTAPEIKGYKPSPATVDAQTVNGQAQDQTITITYAQVPEIWTKTDEQKTYTYEYRTWYQYDAGGNIPGGPFYTQPFAEHKDDQPWINGQQPANSKTVTIVLTKYTSNLGNEQWRINRDASQDLNTLTDGYLINHQTGYSIHFAESQVTDGQLLSALTYKQTSTLSELLGHTYPAINEADANQDNITIPGGLTIGDNDVINLNDMKNNIIDIFYSANNEPFTVNFIDQDSNKSVQKVSFGKAAYDWSRYVWSIGSWMPDGYHLSNKVGRPIPGFDMQKSIQNGSYGIDYVPTDNDNFIYYVQKNQNTTGLNPFDKTTVKDPEHLTDNEKGQVQTNIKKNNEDKHISTIEVGDDGNTTLTFEDGTQSELAPDQTIIAYKSDDPLINTGDADADLTPFDKAPVKNPDHLTNDEKGQVQTNVKKTNSDKHISTIDVKDNGRTIITFEDGTQKELTPDQTIIAYKSGDPLINTGDADADLNPFDKTSVKDPSHLTDDEKGQVQTNIKKTNSDKHISTIDVKDNGRTIITFEDGTQKELTPEETITQLPAEKPEAPKVTPEEQSTTPGKTAPTGENDQVIGTSTTKPVTNQSSAQQQKQQQLPQTGDNHEAAVAGLGLAVAMMSMFGLKKRKED